MPRKKEASPSHMESNKNYSLSELEQISKKLRMTVIEMLLEAQSGHSAGPIGIADIITVLYFHTLNITPSTMHDPNRDRFVLSSGHLCPVLYAALSERGFFDKKHLMKLRKISSLLQGHPHNLTTPGIETSSGPLGQGLSQAIGMAVALQLEESVARVYCLSSDGDLNEGQTWEAALFAGSKRLNNLVWIIDRNNIQIDGYTEDTLPLEPLREKLEAFNFYVIEIDGHNIEEIISALNKSKAIFERPTAIIAHTIPGYGIDFMQYKFEWHGKPPSRKESQAALRQLRSLDGRILTDYD